MTEATIPPFSQSLSAYLENSNRIDQDSRWDLLTSVKGHQTHSAALLGALRFMHGAPRNRFSRVPLDSRRP